MLARGNGFVGPGFPQGMPIGGQVGGGMQFGPRTPQRPVWESPPQRPVWESPPQRPVWEQPPRQAQIPGGGRRVAGPSAPSRLEHQWAKEGIGGTNMKARIEQLLNDSHLLEMTVRQRFREVATPSVDPRTGQQIQTLGYEEAEGILVMLARQLEVDPSQLGDFGQMFWRYDFTGDGTLDEDEATKMAMTALRTYRDATRPPAPGVVKLGGNIEFRRNLEERYIVEKKLGEGGQGAVYLGSDRRSGQKVVVKYYDKSSPNAPIEDITKEFELMMTLNHPRIAHYFEIFQDHANIYVVQEPYFGGDLTTAVQKASEVGVRVNERWMAGVMHQCIAGVAFLHANDVMHCDLKEANVMVAGKEDWDSPQVVVIDFGLCNNFNSKSHVGGTPGYMPPEVWQHGLWTPKGDVFSIGVMFFAMRTATNPFQEGCLSIEDVKRATLNKSPTMTLGTEPMKKLTMAMLEKNFRKRIVLSDVAEDPWFNCSEGSDPTASIDPSVLEGLTRKRNSTELKRAVLADLAARANLAEMRDLNEFFIQLDKDNDGTLSAKEVRSGLAGKWADQEIERFITAMGALDDHVVSYEEFMGQLMASKEPEENALLSRLFNEFDAERKGYLNYNNIKELLKRPAIQRVLGSRDPDRLMRAMDKDSSGHISFNEFRAAMGAREWEGIPHARPSERQEIYVGQRLQYYSARFNSWIPVVVTEIDKKCGAIQIDVKPGYWFKGQDLKTKIRHPSKGQAVSPIAGTARQVFAGMMDMMKD